MARIFHLSDLHIDKVALPDQHRFFRGLEGHNIEVWRAFRTHFLSRLKETNDDYFIIVTGDLTATGHPDCFELCTELLFNKPTSTLSKEIGLRLPNEKFLIIPGNHDSYGGKVALENTLTAFNGHFHPSAEYPITISLKVGGLEIAVIGFDSTYTNNGYTLPKKLGRGIIYKNQFHIAEGFLRERKCDFSIACLHHNPIFPPNVSRDWNLILEHSNDFMAWLTKTNVDLVLFGHIHDDFYDVLPLKSLLRYLPKKRGLKAFANRLFYKTNVLMEYEPIRIYGKSMRFIDTLAYNYIVSKLKKKQYSTPQDFTTKERFETYLHALPEYKEFMEDLNSFHNRTTALVMAGTTCQHSSERKNSYIEMILDKEKGKSITVLRHKYNAVTGGFDSVTTVLELNRK
ncbi:MAG: metallophosphoesterase [Planctomycetes bacterium]|nr:metallophosphoesterase [Planctomycetota bacterium]